MADVPLENQIVRFHIPTVLSAIAAIVVATAFVIMTYSSFDNRIANNAQAMEQANIKEFPTFKTAIEGKVDNIDVNLKKLLENFDLKPKE